MEVASGRRSGRLREKVEFRTPSLREGDERARRSLAPTRNVAFAARSAEVHAVRTTAVRIRPAETPDPTIGYGGHATVRLTTGHSRPLDTR